MNKTMFVCYSYIVYIKHFHLHALLIFIVYYVKNHYRKHFLNQICLHFSILHSVQSYENKLVLSC